jgi:hypothetical protein
MRSSICRDRMADRRGEQRLRDAGRHHGEARVLGGRDGGEGVHDADHRAEEADIGAGRTHGGEDQEAGVQALHLPVDRDVEHLVDALRQALHRAARALERALPLAHGGDEHRREPRRGPARQGPVELVQGLPGPEHLLEAVHGALRAGEQQRLVDDDGPAPDRRTEQPQHHELDKEVRLPEQAEERHVVRDGRHVGWVHSLVLARRAAANRPSHPRS